MNTAQRESNVVTFDAVQRHFGKYTAEPQPRLIGLASDPTAIAVVSVSPFKGSWLGSKLLSSPGIYASARWLITEGSFYTLNQALDLAGSDQLAYADPVHFSTITRLSAVGKARVEPLPKTRAINAGMITFAARYLSEGADELTDIPPDHRDLVIRAYAAAYLLNASNNWARA